MSDDVEFLSNYKPNHLYVHPGKSGAYAAMAGDSEEVIGELEITVRCRVAVSAFFVSERRDFGTLKITKLVKHARRGWREDGHIKMNHFQLAQIHQFLEIIGSLDLSDAQKARISLENIHLGALGTLLGSPKGVELLRALSGSPELHQDVYAVAAKRVALDEFEGLLSRDDVAERIWQAFFEQNPWIFGHGLNYVFLEKVGERLEAQTTGSTFEQAGKRADGLMLTKAEVSQYVLVEIKRSDSPLVRKNAYRPGCWSASDALSDAVTQTQKTVFEFCKSRFRDTLRDQEGFRTGQDVYAVQPRSYLVIGNLKQLAAHDDKVACFELYRRNIRSPDILTFDELFHRARCIVDNISRTNDPQ